MANWVTVWCQSHTNIRTVTPKYGNRTMWMTIPVGVSGNQVRLCFSNREGSTNLTILQTAVSTDDGLRHPVTFDGRETLVLAPGENRYSDALSLKAGRYLSVYAAFRGSVTSGNCIAAHVQCSKNGNFVWTPQMEISRRNFLDSYWGNLPGIPAISAVEIKTEERPRVIVCFGDSITQQSKWTAPLEELLNQAGRNTVVLNAGIGGNRLLLGPPEPGLQVFGTAGIQRFPQDVLGVAGATAVILAMGTNDIGWIRTPEELKTAGADAVFAALERLAAMAHEAGLTVYGATLTPRNGSLDYSPEQEEQRLLLNEKIRCGSCFDAVMDFAAATAAKHDGSILAPHFDSGDHLHPSGLGGRSMAECAFHTILENHG